jgi:hypothetical protein
MVADAEAVRMGDFTQLKAPSRGRGQLVNEGEL